ncbi:MAG: TlpA family protein disulfide reductase [Thermoleophilaceae bacterium]
MAEDSFDDLGGDAPGRSAAERLAEEDRLRPEADDPRRRPPDQARPTNRYAWLVGVLLLMGIGVLLITTALPNTGEGLEGPPAGKIAPAFAAPLASGNIDDGDVNVCQRARACNEQSGAIPACQVKSKVVLNSCQLRRRPLVLTFLVTKGADCEPQVDRVERIRSEFPQVEFAAIVSGDKREEVDQIASNRRWKEPVGVDRDGALTNIYGVGVCPTTVFSYPGGRVRTTKLGNLSEAQLRDQVKRILRAP